MILLNSLTLSAVIIPTIFKKFIF